MVKAAPGRNARPAPPRTHEAARGGSRAPRVRKAHCRLPGNGPTIYDRWMPIDKGATWRPSVGGPSGGSHREDRPRQRASRGPCTPRSPGRAPPEPEMGKQASRHGMQDGCERLQLATGTPKGDQKPPSPSHLTKGIISQSSEREKGREHRCRARKAAAFSKHRSLPPASTIRASGRTWRDGRGAAAGAEGNAFSAAPAGCDFQKRDGLSISPAPCTGTCPGPDPRRICRMGGAAPGRGGAGGGNMNLAAMP